MAFRNEFIPLMSSAMEGRMFLPCGGSRIQGTILKLEITKLPILNLSASKIVRNNLPPFINLLVLDIFARVG